MEWLEMILSILGVGVMFGWVMFEPEKPPPPLKRSTPWKWRVRRLSIDCFGVSPSPNTMWDIVTEDKKHVTFFEEADGYLLRYDINGTNDVPRISFRSRLVPPRKVEVEMILHAKTQQQLWDLRIPENAMYAYLLRSFYEFQRV